MLKTNRNGYRTLYIAFQNEQDRNAVHDALSNYLPEQCKSDDIPIIEYTREWVKGSLSNFDYLAILNTYGQRSTQDLTQYPVYPWVIQDYKSNVLDLNNPEVYRDLTQPIGAINKKRLEDFKSRYYELPEEDRYLYGTHYSCPGYVIGFLVR